MAGFLASSFVLFGSSHLAALIAMMSTASTLVVSVRLTANPRISNTVAFAVACVLIVNRLVTIGVAAHDGRFNFQNSLPLHLCDLAAICAVIALFTRNQLAYELAYFWGLGGTLQAVITPDLALDFPDIHYVTFFVGHCGIIVAVAYLTLGLKMRPWPRSLIRIFWACQVYLVVVAVVDFLTGANYGYVRAKPLHASLMDHLGPWPYYLIGLEALALVSFAFYYIPFFITDQLHCRAQRRSHSA